MSDEAETADADGQKPLELRDWDIKDFQNLLFAAFQPVYKNTETSGKVSGELEKLRKEADMDRQRADEMTELPLAANCQNWTAVTIDSAEIVDDRSSVADLPYRVANGCDIDGIAKRILLANSSPEQLEVTIDKQSRNRNDGAVAATVTEFAKAALGPYAKRNIDISSIEPRSLRQALSVEFRAINDDKQTPQNMSGSLPMLSSHGAFSDTQLSINRQNKWINERHKRTGNFINSDQIEGFRGTDTLECLMEYIGRDEKKANKYSSCDRRGEDALTNAKKGSTKKNGKKERKQSKRNSCDPVGGYCSEDGMSSQINDASDPETANATASTQQRVEVKSEEILECNDDDFIPVKNRRHVKAANKCDRGAKMDFKIDFKATRKSRAHYRSSTPPPTVSSSSTKKHDQMSKRRRSVEDMGSKRGRRRFGRPKAPMGRSSHSALTSPKEATFFDFEKSFPPLPSLAAVDNVTTNDGVADVGDHREVASLTSSRDASPKKSYNEKRCSLASSPTLIVNLKCKSDNDVNGYSSYASLCVEEQSTTRTTATYASVISGNCLSVEKGKADTASRQWVKSSSDKDLNKSVVGADFLRQTTNDAPTTIDRRPSKAAPSEASSATDESGTSDLNASEAKADGATDAAEAARSVADRPVMRAKQSAIFLFLADAWKDFVSDANCKIETAPPKCC